MSNPWITGMGSNKTADTGYVWLYGCRSKSALAGLGCGLGRTPVLSVMHSTSAAEAVYAACGAI